MATEIVRELVDGEWVTTVGSGGGGGGIPDPIVTPVTIQQPDPTVDSLTVLGPEDPDDEEANLIVAKDSGGVRRFAVATTGFSRLTLSTTDAAKFIITAESVGDVFEVRGAGTIGFFGAPPVARPTGVAVTAAGIHAALVSLGLIAA